MKLSLIAILSLLLHSWAADSISVGKWNDDLRELEEQAYYSQLIDSDTVDSSFAISFSYIKSKSLPELKKLALANDIKAQYHLAYLFYRGGGVDNNLDSARYYFTLAANQGHNPSQFYLKIMKVLDKKEVGEEAVLCMEDFGPILGKLLLVGFALFFYFLVSGRKEEEGRNGTSFDTTVPEIDDLLAPVRAREEAQRVRALADTAYKREENYSKAFKKYKRAAELGDATAQKALAFLYYNGDGVEPDHKLARVWFKKAAKQGDLEAQYHLSSIYYQGFSEEGAGRDYKQSFYWCLEAAQRGYEEAFKSVAILYYCGEGVEKNLSLFLHWFQKAAEKGDSEAALLLGDMYSQGEGVEADEDLALQWYWEAADLGNPVAQEIIDRHFG